MNTKQIVKALLLSAVVGQSLKTADPVNTLPSSTKDVVTGVETSLGGFSVADVNGNLQKTVLTVTRGTLKTTSHSFAKEITLSGKSAAVNLELQSLSYKSDDSFTGSETLTMTSTDASSGEDTDDLVFLVVLPGCPENYIGKEGHVEKTKKKVIRIKKLPNDLAECSAKCTKKKQCVSFEWNKEERECQLNKKVETFGGAKDGWFLCVKSI